MKQIYLHIGLHKTGSTAIQFFIKKNRQIFLNNKIYIPEHACEFKSLANHCNIVFENLNNYKFENNQLNALCSEIKEWNKVIISSETFEFLLNKKNEFNKIINTFKKLNFKIKVILYFRNDKNFLSSRYVELIKSKKFNQTMKVPNFFIFFIKAFLFGYVEILPQKWTCYFSNLPQKLLSNFDIEKVFIDYNKNKTHINRSFLEAINIKNNNFELTSDFLNKTDTEKYKKYYFGIYKIMSSIIYYKRKIF